MPTNYPQKPEEPKWKPEKDPHPISQAEENVADGIWCLALGIIIFIPATFLPVPEAVVEHADFFRGSALAFMALSFYKLWGARL